MMEKYQFGESESKLIESLSVPMAVYQFTDKRVVTLALSRGFCELFGFDDLEEAYRLMDNDMYRDAHPDDVARISEDAYRFAAEGGEYEALYRNRGPKDNEYRLIHAQGRHEYTDTGERIAVIWYTDEGIYDDTGNLKVSSLSRTMADALHRESIMQTGNYDPLTGLPNMALFFQMSESERDRILSENSRPAMVFFDLNGMTEFNSRYGFAEGDRLLREFAKLLVKHFGSNACGRFGQDHFIACADDNGLKEKLEVLFEELKTINEGRTLTVKVGIFLKIIGTTLDAGVACDRAKAAADSIEDPSVSSYRYFDREMLDEIDRRQYIIDNLDRALEEKWIKVWYQPIIRAANGMVCDEEALSRWIDPDRGLLSPDEFIPVLEKAHLTYKLDLYVVEEILRKIKMNEKEGLYIVPQSVNLSRYDFESCDIVEEIRRRVDDAGVSHDKMTIEITESVIGSDYDYMTAQVERLHKLGFNVWMDDFGSDYSSLDYLLNIPFDLIKLDKKFMDQFSSGEKSRVILTELVRMAMNLGIETVCEGVEREEQAEFLREIGCTKLQGYYYCKPIPPEEILERNRKGEQIGYENPDEASYYEAIGRINLYDVSGIGREEADLQEYFDTIPMSIVEFNGSFYDIIRESRSFREFKERYKPKMTEALIRAMRKCADTGSDTVFDEELKNGMLIHMYLKRVAVNPVTGVSAIAVVILATNMKSQQAPGTTSAAVARALAANYFDLYYINIDTEDFMQYSMDEESAEIAVRRNGTNFFTEAKKDALKYIYKPDQKLFMEVFNRETILKALDESNVFTFTYRIMTADDSTILDSEGRPVYVSMKITRIGNDDSHVIMGVSNVDTEMRHKAELERIESERKTYSRITAITGDYLVFYTVDPETEEYTEYYASNMYEQFGVSKEGRNFFEEARKNSVRTVYPMDLDMVLSELTKENVMNSILANGIFALQYRLMIGGEPRYINLKAGMSEEEDGEKLIVGINDIDARVKGGLEYTQKMEAVRQLAPDVKAGREEGFQFIADSISKPCAILSVEKREDGSCGDIRIIRANKAYRETMGPGYRDGMLYHELVPKDIKFEDFCYRAAILGQKMHTYVETRALDAWTDLELIPMTSDDESTGYCQFLFEFTKGAEAERMADVSIQTADTAIRACIKLMGSKDFKESVRSVLEDIRRLGDALCCEVLLVDDDKKTVEKYCQALRADSRFADVDIEDVLPYELVKTWKDMMEDSNCIIVKSPHDIDSIAERNPEWAASLKEHGVESIIFMPLYQNRSIFGYLYLSEFNTDNVVELKEIMELISFFLGTEISNTLLHERMNIMLRTDTLTGANNRYAMLDRIAGLSGKPFGIISLDLNGLKRTNDTFGHDAGDRMLVQAAEVLSKVFYQEDIFRTGGDEFVVISADISEGVFERKIARLRRDIEKNVDVSFSMGSYWSDGTAEPSEAFRIADDNMYQDKREYYLSHPELKTR